VKKALIALLALTVVAGLAALAAVAVLRGGGKGAQVFAEPVERRDITQLVKASGAVNARVQVNLSSHLIGKIERLYVAEGQAVAATQPFLELEKPAFIAARDDWASRLAIARHDVEQARVSLADAELKARRAGRLQAEGIASAEQLEGAELALASARLRLAQAEQSVMLAEANLVKARDDLAKTTLYAPVAGRVVSLRAREGEVVVSGTMNNPASVIATIADLSQILAEVDVDETEIARVQVGQEAILKVDALADRAFRGRVEEIGSSGYSRSQQPDVTFFQVKILFAQPDPELRPGMSVRADVETATHRQAVVVPIQAVVERPPPDGADEDGAGEPTPAAEGVDEEVPVIFVIEDGKARQRPVATALADETHVELASGAEPGEQVVTGPYRVLKELDDGDPVRVRKPREDGEEPDEER
jgi:HlyD family secretion protein